MMSASEGGHGKLMYYSKKVAWILHYKSVPNLDKVKKSENFVDVISGCSLGPLTYPLAVRGPGSPLRWYNDVYWPEGEASRRLVAMQQPYRITQNYWFPRLSGGPGLNPPFLLSFMPAAEIERRKASPQKPNNIQQRLSMKSIHATTYCH